MTVPATTDTRQDDNDLFLDLEHRMGTAGLENACLAWMRAAADRLASVHYGRDLRAAHSTAKFLDYLGLPEYAEAVRANPTPWPTGTPFPAPREAVTP